MSAFGVASAILAVIALTAAALIALTWSRHATAEAGAAIRPGAAGRLTVDLGLINMNADNVEASMAQLRDGTVGELNNGFDSSIAPYRDVVKTLRSRTTGQVESVSIEEVHNDLQPQPGQRPAAPTALPPEFARARTPSLWWPPRSVRTPAPRRRPRHPVLRPGRSPSAGTCVSGFPTSTARR